MKICDKCGLEYKNSLEECPWCKTNIGVIQQKINKKNKIEGNIFKTVIILFIITLIFNIIYKLFPTYFLWIALVLYIVIYFIIDEILCNRIKKEKESILTEEESNELKQYFVNKKDEILPKIKGTGKYLSGIPKILGESMCEIKCLEEKLLIEMVSNGKKIYLPYNHIIAVGKQTKTDLVTTYQNRSVIGRGITGGLLFGSTGAILGGLSAVVPKIQNIPTQTNYLCVKYISSENEEDVIIIEIEKIKPIIDFLNEKIENENEEIEL